jgi:hypothetical protein
MSEDITTRLLAAARAIEIGSGSSPTSELHRDSLSEIERLRREKRLQWPGERPKERRKPGRAASYAADAFRDAGKGRRS